jgi:heme-degrading monooxygenase HmoA
MRFVYLKIKPEKIQELTEYYNQTVIPQLNKLPGCLFAGMIQSESSADESVSLTLWDSFENADSYEKSGLYEELLQGLKEYLSESSEWKIQLSKDLKLEYQPVPEETIVKSHSSLAQTNNNIPVSDKMQSMYVRIVSGKIKTDKMEEFREIYNNEILKELKTVKGFRNAFSTQSTEDSNEVFSITIWDSKEDADNYEKSGLYEQLVALVKHTFTEISQWKISLENDKSKKAVTSDDLTIDYYNVVTGKSFK